MVQLQSSRIFVATSRIITAQVALTRQEWTRAEEEARASRTGLLGVLPYWMMASTHLLTALLRQGRGAEAAALAREDLDAYARVGGPICSEVMFKVAVAEAFFAGEDEQGARSMLADALAQIAVRLERIPEAALKQAYLMGRPENRRAVDLATAWRVSPS